MKTKPHLLALALMFAIAVIFGTSSVTAGYSKPQASAAVSAVQIDKAEFTVLPARQMTLIRVRKDDVAWKDGGMLNALPHPKSMKPSEAIARYNTSPSAGGHQYQIAMIEHSAVPRELRADIESFKSTLKPELRDQTTVTYIVRGGKSNRQASSSGAGSSSAPPSGGQ